MSAPVLTRNRTPALEVEICVGAIPGAWAASAACRDADAEIFFPEKGQGYAAARKICAGCPVLRECRAYIDRIEAEVGQTGWLGMYGGESPRERYRRRRGRSRRPSRDVQPTS